MTSQKDTRLSALGVIRIDGSDAEFGFLNTPAYFALDDLVVVPEPGSGLLLALGLGALAGRRRD